MAFQLDAFQNDAFQLLGAAPAPAADPLVSGRLPLGGLFDMYIDPITLDYVDTDDGEWLETPDSRSIMMCMIDLRLGRSYSAPGDGTRIAELLEAGDPVTPQVVVAECTRAATILAAAGVIAQFSMRTTDDRGEILVDDKGRFTPQLAWIDLATGSPVDLVFTPEAR